MTILRISVAEMVGGAPPTSLQGRITPRPNDGVANSDELLAPRRGLFQLAEDGMASVEVEPNPSGTWYELEIRDVGVWRLVVDADKDPVTAHEAVHRFNELRPDGGTPNVERIPVVGPTGPPGPPGPQGATGRGSIWFEGAGNPNSYVFSTPPAELDFYLQTDNANVWEYDGSTWNQVGNLSGQAGDTGPAGPVGPQGPRGPKGDAGANGERGRRVVFIYRQSSTQPARPSGGTYDPFLDTITLPNGWSDRPPNPTANDRVWVSATTVTPQATGSDVTPSWSSPAAWSGARGAQGAPGVQGPQGAQGIQGPQGDRGATGAQGPAGAKGDTGDRGPAATPTPLNAVALLSDAIALSTTWATVIALSELPDTFLAVITIGNNETTELIIKSDIGVHEVSVNSGQRNNRYVDLREQNNNLQARVDSGTGMIRVYRLEGAGSGSGGGGGTPATYVDGLSLSGQTLTVSREGTSAPSDQTITLPTNTGPAGPRGPKGDPGAQGPAGPQGPSGANDLHTGWRVSDISRVTTRESNQYHTVFDSRFARFTFQATADNPPSWDLSDSGLAWRVPHINRPNGGWPSPRSGIWFLIEVPNNGSPEAVEFGVEPDTSTPSNPIVWPMAVDAVTPANARNGYVYYQSRTAHTLSASISQVSLVALGGASGGHTFYNGLIPQRSVGEALFVNDPFVAGNAGQFVAINRAGNHFELVDPPSGGGSAPATYVDGLSLSGNSLTVSREGTSNPNDQTITLPTNTGPRGPAGPKGDKGDAGSLGGGGVNAIVAVANQSAYDAIVDKVATTLYIWPA